MPDKFLSDNGPQYISQEFVNFAKEYDFKLITRSPYYASATGKAESCVKEAEMSLKKSDLLTGLLDHRNTPPQGMTKSTLPMSETLLGQSVSPVASVGDEHLAPKQKLTMTKLPIET